MPLMQLRRLNISNFLSLFKFIFFYEKVNVATYKKYWLFMNDALLFLNI